jgi:hypothetical protein
MHRGLERLLDVGGLGFEPGELASFAVNPPEQRQDHGSNCNPPQCQQTAAAQCLARFERKQLSTRVAPDRGTPRRRALDRLNGQTEFVTQPFGLLGVEVSP